MNEKLTACAQCGFYEFCWVAGYRGQREHCLAIPKDPKNLAFSFDSISGRWDSDPMKINIDGHCPYFKPRTKA
jgi:hypothetical protein